MSLFAFQNKSWVYYRAEEEQALSSLEVGKWMYFFKREGVAFAAELCQKAIEEGVVLSCKHTNCETDPRPEGVCCFYVDSDDGEGHKRVISFFLKNNLIRKTKAGKYCNIAFKLDSQTSARAYGDAFEATIKLSDFIDLATGEWLAENA